MNKFLILLSACALIAACSSESNKTAINPNDTLMWNQNPNENATASDAAAAPATGAPADTAATPTAAAAAVPTTAAAADVSTSAKPAPVAAAGAKPAAAAKAPQADGKQLLSKSDCLACHQEQQKVVGPAYVDVAKKYQPTEANINQLVNKIIAGGAGVWGAIPMSPHPSLSKDDARAMVKYILSIK